MPNLVNGERTLEEGVGLSTKLRYSRDSSEILSCSGGVQTDMPLTSSGPFDRDNLSCVRHHLDSCIVYSQHHEDGAVASIRRHDAATLQYRVGPYGPRRSLPRIAVTHPSHMGSDVPFAAGALHPAAESSGSAEGC